MVGRASEVDRNEPKIVVEPSATKQPVYKEAARPSLVETFLAMEEHGLITLSPAGREMLQFLVTT